MKLGKIKLGEPIKKEIKTGTIIITLIDNTVVTFEMEIINIKTDKENNLNLNGKIKEIIKK